jgi:hypothetical protein
MNADFRFFSPKPFSFSYKITKFKDYQNTLDCLLRPEVLDANLFENQQKYHNEIHLLKL